MKVAHVLRKYDPAAWGGTETHVAAVTERLGARGWSSEVYAPTGPTTPDTELSVEVPLTRYRAHCPFVGSAEQRRALWENAGNILSIDLPARLMRDPSLSLIHLHTAGRIGGSARLVSRLRGFPYVISLHGPVAADPEFLREDTARRLSGTVDFGKPFGALVGARRVLDDAARVICFHEAERRALEPRLGSRILRMDHGVDARRLAAGRPERAVERWPELAGRRLILQIGRLARQKNQELSLTALAGADRRDVALVLVGAETDPGERARLEEHARQLGVAERVHFLGNVGPFQDIPDLLALAEVVLVPSLHEAFGLAVLEAWAAGRPVIFSATTGLVDLARFSTPELGALEDHDAARWASALGRMLDDQTLRQRAAMAGQTLVHLRYTWERVVERLAGVYAEVLQESVVSGRSISPRAISI